MKSSKRTITIAVATVGLATLLTYAHAGQSLKLDFSDETVGAEPKSFVSVVGVWRSSALLGSLWASMRSAHGNGSPVRGPGRRTHPGVTRAEARSWRWPP